MIIPSDHVELPDGVRPYLFHGVPLHWKPTDKNAVGDCPYCGREGKFSVNLQTSKSQCWVCQQTGNARTFVQWLHEESNKATTIYQDLATERRLLYPDTLAQWGLVTSVLTGDWLVPGYSAEGHLVQVYRYVQGKGRRFLQPTPTLGHALFGMGLWNSRHKNVYLCEGGWDAMALWETLGNAKPHSTEEGKYLPTANRQISLLAGCNVLATPTCSVFNRSWLPLFAGRTVTLLYHNDHPGVNPKTGKPTPSAGMAAQERVIGLLRQAVDPPAEIHRVRWGPDGHNLELPSGYDVRDDLT